MMSGSQEVSGLDQIMARALEQNPHSREILKAFGPIIARQRNLSASGQLKKADAPSVEQDKLKAGVPVSRQIRLFFPEDPWKEIVLSLCIGG